jgi:hypothetical protein
MRIVIQTWESLRFFLRIRKAVRKYIKTSKSISLFLENAKSYYYINEILQNLPNIYTSITKLQFLTKYSAEIWKRIKPDHLTIFPSQKIQLQPPNFFIVNEKFDSECLRKRILRIWILTVFDSTNPHSFLLGFTFPVGQTQTTHILSLGNLQILIESYSRILLVCFHVLLINQLLIIVLLKSNDHQFPQSKKIKNEMVCQLNLILAILDASISTVFVDCTAFVYFWGNLSSPAFWLLFRIYRESFVCFFLDTSISFICVLALE